MPTVEIPDMDGWEKVTVRHWRIVKAIDDGGGIMFSATDREHDPTAIIDKWVKRFTEYGHKVHVEIWDQTYTVSPATWTQVAGPGAEGDRT